MGGDPAPTPRQSLPASLSFLSHFTHRLSAARFPQQPLPSHLLHPGAPRRSRYLTQHPANGAAAAWGCSVSGHCWDLTLLPSGFTAERSLKNRKQNKAVRKCDICGVFLKAEWQWRLLWREAVSLGGVWILSRTSYSAGLLV